MILYPNAKINLGLYVTEKRADGYHNIETIFYPIAWSDMLEIIPDSTQSSGVTLSISGISIPGNLQDNLCCKVYDLISKDYPMPAVKVHLHKQIPTGAGLGGGSSDAAFFIRGLNELFELNLSWGEMHQYAKQIGADCSFFITNRPVFAEGKGDELEGVSLSLKDFSIMLIHPGIHISTPEAYAMIKPQKPNLDLKEWIVNSDIAEWKTNLRNDFENPVFEKEPEIAEIKKTLYDAGAIYAAMSGSGSAVFGIFENEIPEIKFPETYTVWKG
jgi:4-diphosphocytidyl-2-C-methyl-D-erythritol kinase